ncbi:zinc ribbon domain-containing protein, partial [Marichromatium sp. AB32]
MQCPKCRAEQSDHADICTACGLVFAKYYKHHPPAGEAPARPR